MSDSKSPSEINEDKTVASKPPKQKRKFEWTEKRKEAFEKCQKAKKQQLESSKSPKPEQTESEKQSKPTSEEQVSETIPPSKQKLSKHKRNKKKLLKLMEKHYFAKVPELKQEEEDEEEEEEDQEGDSFDEGDSSDSEETSSQSSESESDTEMKPLAKKKKSNSKTVSKAHIMNELKHLQDLVQKQQHHRPSKKRKFKKYHRPEKEETDYHLLPAHTTPVTESHSRRSVNPPEESFAHGNINTPSSLTNSSRYRFI